MNARLYDPALGRFLSPDPYVQMPDFTQSFNRYSYCLNNPLRYTDPTGEYFGIDDLIAALIGGTVNLVINIVQGNIHSFGQGLASFGVGAAGGVLTIYVGPWAGGAVIGAGNSFVNQGFGETGNWDWSNINGQQVLFDGIMGGLTGEIGSKLGGFISPYVSGITSNLGGQAIQQAATQAITGSATGFAMGTGFALMNGESFGEALEAGGKGALTGFAVGTVTGMASGMRAAYKAKENPWTGGKSQLKYDSKQVGKKYGEHMKDYPGLSHDDYINLAKEIYSDPLSIKTSYPSNAPRYGGETHYYKGGNLLRIAPDGMFRSMYPYSY